MKKVRTSIATLILIEDHIIHMKIDDNADFGLDEMLEVREANRILSDGEDYCVLMEAGSLTHFSKEAMQASAAPEHTKSRIALAIIESNLGMTIITNFYLKINKPVGATKAFRSVDKAKEWLLIMRDKAFKK